MNLFICINSVFIHETISCLHIFDVLYTKHKLVFLLFCIRFGVSFRFIFFTLKFSPTLENLWMKNRIRRIITIHYAATVYWCSDVVWQLILIGRKCREIWNSYKQTMSVPRIWCVFLSFSMNTQRPVVCSLCTEHFVSSRSHLNDMSLHITIFLTLVVYMWIIAPLESIFRL